MRYSLSLQPRQCAHWFFGVVALVLLNGCKLPDLKPFSDASSAVASSVKTSGDLVVEPLQASRIWSPEEQRWLSPGDPKHPGAALAESWAARRRATDAILAYSASLASISDAAAHGKENAEAVVGAVKELASEAGFSTGANSVGELVVWVAKEFVEVKAFHDLSRAVQAAQPAIDLIARGLTNDFATLGVTYQSLELNNRIGAVAALRRVDRLRTSLMTERDKWRDTVAKAPTNAVAGAELARLDGLLASVQAEYDRHTADRQAAEQSLNTGAKFFAAAQQAVLAWAKAHSDLALALKQGRRPDVILLAIRARELAGLIEELRIELHNPK